MALRDRCRVYKKVCLMFFLAVVTLTVLQRGNISTGPPFHLERQTEFGLSEEGESRKDPQTLGNHFWKPMKQRSQATTFEDHHSLGNQGSITTRSWDVTSTNCSANLNFSNSDWFIGLETNFKQFLLYRHCRYFPMIINHPEKCAGDIYLLMVVKSVITQHDRREVIRQTWGREQEVNGKRIRTIFLLGAPSNEAEKANHQKLLEYEDYIYGDIIQWDFMDSFFNLTLKETHFLKWFSTYCLNVHFIFKGDDDVYVSVQNILQYLDISSDVTNLFAGDVIFKAKPIRKKDNKYYIPQALYNKTNYPPYAGGGGFLMDAHLAQKLHSISETLELYPIDDVFLGMCLEVLGVIPIKHNAFKTFGLMKNKKSRLNREPCFFKSMIVVHKLLPQELVNMWKLVHSDINCSQKVQHL